MVCYLLLMMMVPGGNVISYNRAMAALRLLRRCLIM